MNETKLENGPAAASEGIDKTAADSARSTFLKTELFCAAKLRNNRSPLQSLLPGLPTR